MRFTTSIIAAFGMISLASAHVKMVSPTPFDAANLDNAPLFADGTNFPCKMPNYDNAVINTMVQGEPQTLSLLGSAVHGGGSCQISITYDNPPTPQSEWKVIHSIEGGCPMAGVAGNNGDNAASPVPDTFQYTIPTGLQTGPAVLAWTWFNKIGNREMYMNCAPIDIKGANGKRTALESRIVSKIANRQNGAFSALPNMFKANIGNGCNTLEGTDVEFPNPGQSLELRQQQAMAALGKPVGSCGIAGTEPVVEAPSSPSPIASAAPSVSPGEFVELPGPVDGDRAAENKPVENAPVYDAPVVAEPTPSPEPAAPIEEAPAPQPEAPAQNETAPAPEIPTIGGSITPGTPCPSDEGMWNCVDSTFFQRCASGQWSVIQAIASGTTCASGISSSIKVVSMPAAKREVRFSNAHVRRHINARSF